MQLIYVSNGYFGAKVLKSMRPEFLSKMSALITTPDKRQGRGLRIQSNPARQAAEQLGLQCIVADRVSDRIVAEQIREHNPDYLLVCDFGQYIPTKYTGSTRPQWFNIHPSLLPRHRGASPIREAIFNGDALTGVSYIRVAPKMDTGNIICSRQCEVEPSDDFSTLQHKLARLSVDLFGEFHSLVEKGIQKETAQDESKATYTRKLTKEFCRVDWGFETRSIVNKIRGLCPTPGAYTFFRGARVKVMKAFPSDVGESGRPGSIVAVGPDIHVQTSDGSVRIVSLQPEGKHVMQAIDFINGYRPRVGEQFS